ncbi:hypothetical protein EMCRGX_G005439 [Ephydatia muelleri]
MTSRDSEGELEVGGAGRAKSDETTEDAPAETWILHLHIGYPSQSTFKCPICDVYCNTLASLRRHINTSHSDYTLNEVFVCDTCGEESTTVKGIKSHQKSTHSGVLPPPPIPHSAFPCPHCELSFPSKLSCSQHVRGRHMDEACQTRAKADNHLSDGKRKAWDQVVVDKFKLALLQFGPLSNVAIANAIGTRTCKQAAPPPVPALLPLALVQAQSAEIKGCSSTGLSAGKGILERYITQMQPNVLKGEKLTRVNELLVKAFTANLLPPKLMDSPEFREFLDYISNGSYEIPHRTKTTLLIDMQYENVLKKIKAMIADAVSVSIKTDTASMHTGDSYIAITAHWLDSQWNLMSCVLGVSISNAEEISSIVKGSVNTEFMLENRLDAIASDQGANFVAAIRKLIEEGISEEQNDFMQHQQQPDAAGCAENESQEDDGVKSEDESHEDDGVQPEDESDAIVDVPMLPHRRSLKLIKDICTRWNSTFYMLQRCVLLQKHITNVLAESKYAHLVPSADEWLAAEKLCSLLKSFQIATDFLQTIFSQLRTEMMNVVQKDEADEDGSDDKDYHEPPAKKAAVTSAEEDFDLLFGQKDQSPREEIAVGDEDHIEDEYQRYLKEAEINFRKDDPIEWWRKHEVHFPHVAKLARKYLSIPAYTASAERVFSTAKNILQKKRWSLLPERLAYS